LPVDVLLASLSVTPDPAWMTIAVALLTTLMTVPMSNATLLLGGTVTLLVM